MFLLYYCFFFFKQKTAYEMRISDWSSDVCSSDLPEYGHIAHSAFGAIARANLPEPQRDHGMVADDFRSFLRQREIAYDARNITQIFRSEEPTSELQSLMRISYAVFCLKKKKN